MNVSLYKNYHLQVCLLCPFVFTGHFDEIPWTDEGLLVTNSPETIRK